MLYSRPFSWVQFRVLGRDAVLGSQPMSEVGKTDLIRFVHRYTSLEHFGHDLDLLHTEAMHTCP